MKRKAPILIFLLVTLTATAAGLTTSIQTPQTTIQPETEQRIGNITIETGPNESVELADIITRRYPFSTSYDASTPMTIQANATIGINVSVPDGIAPGKYTGSTTLSFTNASSTTYDWTITVAENRQYDAELTGVEDSVSIGESGRLATLTIDNDGNVPVRFTASAEGNISDYISISPSITSYAGNTLNESITYQAPKSTPFGTYKGNISLRTSDGNETVLPLSIQFKDRITPVIEEGGLHFDDFMATKPEEFVVQVSDNLEVTSVIANATYTATEQRGNNTVEVTETLEEYNFSSVPNTDRWTVTPENGERIGEYTIKGYAKDASGNLVTFNDSFEIEGLNVTHPRTNIEIPAYRIGSEIQTPLLGIDQESPVDVKLESFSEPLDSANETWRIGIQTPDGREFFDNVNDTVTIEKKGDYNLYVYGDTPSIAEDEKIVYNGRLSYTPVPQHIPIQETTFYGSLKNWSQPQNSTFTVVGTDYNCDAIRGVTKEDAGWTCHVNISRDDVPASESLKDAAQVIVPSDQKSEVENRYQTQIDRWRNQAKSTGKMNLMMMGLSLLLMLGLFYYSKFHGEHYWVKQKSTE